MKREDTIGLRVRELSLAIKNAKPCGRGQTDDGKENSKGSVTKLHGWVIGYLYEHRDQNVYQRDIEKLFSVKRPTMTAILQLMEKNGLIERVRDENDARLKKITLTPDALKIHEYHEREIERFELKLREGISESELNTFFAVIDKLKENIEKSEK